jgi:predicted RNase H-like HicB family nuclease
MKRKSTARVYHYTAVFAPAEEGGFTVTVPALPGCVSEGDTFEEAQENIREALELYLEGVPETNRGPKPSRGLPVVAPIEVRVSS